MLFKGKGKRTLYLDTQIKLREKILISRCHDRLLGIKMLLFCDDFCESLFFRYCSHRQIEYDLAAVLAHRACECIQKRPVVGLCFLRNSKYRIKTRMHA